VRAIEWSCWLAFLGLAFACGGSSTAPDPTATDATDSAQTTGSDPHSFARPDEVVVRHLDLDVTVDFASQTIHGKAALSIENRAQVSQLYLDSRDLDVRRVTLDDGGNTTFQFGDEDPFLGRPLVIDIKPHTQVVHIEYSSRPEAAAVQWLAPEQTAGGNHPFLFTQSQAILARTWIPLQDSPAVRMTYSATVRVPKELMALMSAENPTQLAADGVYHFEMPQAIPSYLMALAVGDVAFGELGPQSGVYAEPALLDKAVYEFQDIEAMIAATEALYGPYQWGRYDVLVLPPSFPFGGMENPRLTFATPTIIAGDRSLVSLIAHELAHSWSGNLVTNSNWDDFWLNEGFTVYLEQRIMEEVYGRDYSEMLAILTRQELDATLAELGPEARDTWLHLDLAGRDPDDGMTNIAYNKGYFLLRALEEATGRENWDAFLKAYFDHFAFQSITTQDFVTYLKAELPKLAPEALDQINIDAWIYGPNLPEGAPQPTSLAFEKVDQYLSQWQSAGTLDAAIPAKWSTHEWLHFLRHLPSPLSTEKMANLDAAFHLSQSGNSEILAAWLGAAITNQYEPAMPALEHFLTTVGRRKFLKPLYTALAKTPEGKERGREIYARARDGYHFVSSATIDEILGWEG